jgi:hypothetical protein
MHNMHNMHNTYTYTHSEQKLPQSWNTHWQNGTDLQNAGSTGVTCYAKYATAGVLPAMVATRHEKWTGARSHDNQKLAV